MIKRISHISYKLLYLGLSLGCITTLTTGTEDFNEFYDYEDFDRWYDQQDKESTFTTKEVIALLGLGSLVVIVGSLYLFPQKEEKPLVPTSPNVLLQTTPRKNLNKRKETVPPQNKLKNFSNETPKTLHNTTTSKSDHNNTQVEPDIDNSFNSTSVRIQTPKNEKNEELKKEINKTKEQDKNALSNDLRNAIIPDMRPNPPKPQLESYNVNPEDVLDDDPDDWKDQSEQSDF